MTELAFDITKCGLPAVLKLPPLTLQDCEIRNAVSNITALPDTSIAPTLPLIPPSAAMVADFKANVGLGRALADIALGGSGLIQLFNCDNPTDKTLTVTARLDRIKAGDYVYYTKFDCGNEVVSNAYVPVLRMGILTSTIAAGTASSPANGTMTEYVINATGTVVSAGVSIPIKNYLASVTGQIGDVVLTMELNNTASSCPTVLFCRSSGTTSGSATQSIGACSPCVGRAALTINNNSYPAVFHIRTIPTELGGVGTGGILDLVYISGNVWESDAFNFACDMGTDSYFWRLTVPALAGCSYAVGSALVTLHSVTSPVHCDDLTDGLTYIYKNLRPFRARCGTPMALNSDACMPVELRTRLPCEICVYP